jgi:ribonuclease-3
VATEPNEEGLAGLEARVGVQLRDRTLLQLALTHRSAVPTAEGPSNERLEFLGDAVLGLVLAEHLYRRFPQLPEGALTKLKAMAVSEVSLVRTARQLDLGRHLVLARSEEMGGGRDRPSLLADALEAVIGAVFVDQGPEAARRFVLSVMADTLTALEEGACDDYKTALQELVQERRKYPPDYRVIEESGPDHDKTFVVEVRVGPAVVGVGVGKSKKEAEQAAAREALEGGELARRLEE